MVRLSLNDPKLEPLIMEVFVALSEIEDKQ